MGGEGNRAQGKQVRAGRAGTLRKSAEAEVHRPAPAAPLSAPVLSDALTHSTGLGSCVSCIVRMVPSPVYASAHFTFQ